jgi:GntR family transcriptional regulator, transcriptional repressor for pyruvate dehydrogenase complex
MIQPSRVDTMAAHLQREIVQGRLQAGEKLPSERTLCASFRVARTTVREALKSLIAQGFVARKGRGIVVADPENLPPRGVDLPALAARASIRHLYEVRKLIEVQMAGWAATRATGEDIEVIRHALQSHDDGKPAQPNRNFHDALAKAAHNPVLSQIYESGRSLFFRLPFYWKLFDDLEVKAVRARRHDLARRWHEHILEAIKQRDVAEAEGAMFQHLDIMEKDLLGRLRVSDGEPLNQNPYLHPMLADFDSEEKHMIQDNSLIR